MTTESQITYLEEQVKIKESEIQEKERNLDILKDGIVMDKQLLKIMRNGLERMKAKSDQK